MRAHCLFRSNIVSRHEAFGAGLAAVGYEVTTHPTPNPQPDDVLVIWNRLNFFNEQARAFEAVGARVLVVENSPLGNQWRGHEWLSLALGHVAVCGGTWKHGGAKRWDSWSVTLAPWHGEIGECVIFAQRSIGELGIASPRDWAETTQRETRGRIRPHPGLGGASVPFEYDLRNAERAVTWASAAGLCALKCGVPVYFAHPRWVGAEAALPLSQFGQKPRRDDAARLKVFQRLAWCVWTLDEIRSGEAFSHLL